MTILTVYVYGPTNMSGPITGLNNYCPDGVHGPCNSGFSSPIDIGVSGGIYLRLNGSNNCKSCITYISTPSCCSARNCTTCTRYTSNPKTCNSDHKRSVKVELYGKADAVCYIGSVEFGHIVNPQVSHSTIYNFNVNPLPLLIGTAMNGTCPGTPLYCVTGTHSHMATKNGTRNTNLACGNTVTTGTVIYTYTWDNAVTCPK